MAQVAFSGLASGAHAAATFPNSHLLAPVVPSMCTRFAGNNVRASWAAPKRASVLDELREAVHDEDWARNYCDGVTPIHMRPEWSASEDRCSALQWLVTSTKAMHILEIGSFCGVGTLALAEAAPPSADVVALELCPFVVDFGKRFQLRSPASQKIKHLVGAAKDSLDRLANDETFERMKPFDLVVVDADKECLKDYFQLLWNTPGLLSEGAVVCVDMTPFKGQPPLRFLKYGFPYQCETNSGQREIDALRTFVKDSPQFTSHEFGKLLIVQKHQVDVDMMAA